MDTTNVPQTEVRDLTCCCCGEGTRGRQWWNRDTGYGMCVTCIEFVKAHGYTERDIHDNYGVAGVHYDVDPDIRAAILARMGVTS